MFSVRSLFRKPVQAQHGPKAGSSFAWTQEPAQWYSHRYLSPMIGVP